MWTDYRLNSSADTIASKKTKLARQIALWISQDLRPFNIASTNGFKKFAINTGIVKNIDEIPTERTIARTALNDVYISVESAMKENLKEIDLVFAIMVDIWTDNIRNRPYINISI
ncbi:hypothetical protein PVAND_013946 [Polypedilum vanderplanki]|uniref:Uncharacterized protein n=1 Tax=Polypedilum vanderplanki TaxID=319348 RepID=A0A9J6CS58_POLVA|nr:hypothetical protein PVAND_013946 [Polypedilum vanderplanki]